MIIATLGWLVESVGAQPSTPPQSGAMVELDLSNPNSSLIQRTEAEFVVEVGRGAFEVPVHAGDYCILTFAEELSPERLVSSPDFEVRAWGKYALAVRGRRKGSKATLAVLSAAKTSALNITLRVVPREARALTFASFRPPRREPESMRSTLSRDPGK